MQLMAAHVGFYQEGKTLRNRGSFLLPDRLENNARNHRCYRDLPWQSVQWASEPIGGRMQVSHGGFYRSMPEYFLHIAYIRSLLK